MFLACMLKSCYYRQRNVSHTQLFRRKGKYKCHTHVPSCRYTCSQPCHCQVMSGYRSKHNEAPMFVRHGKELHQQAGRLSAMQHSPTMCLQCFWRWGYKAGRGGVGAAKRKESSSRRDSTEVTGGGGGKYSVWARHQKSPCESQVA